MQLYEVALVEGETSRELMDRARQLGMGRLTATTELSEDQIQRLCPQRAARIEAALRAQRPPAPGAASPAPAPVGRAPYRHPQMGVVAAVLVAALVVTAVGMAVATGGWSEGDALRRTASRRAEPTVAPAPSRGADAPVVPLDVVDEPAFCAGWPVVVDHWRGFAAELAATTDADALASWAEDHHRSAAVAVRDQVAPAFGPDAPSEVQDVLRWIFDTAYPPAAWEIAQARLVTEAVAPSVAALDALAATTC